MIDIDPAEDRPQGPPAAGPDVPRRHRRGPHRRRRRDQATPRRRAARTAQWLDDGIVELADLPDREHVVFSHDQRAAPPAGVRLHPRGAEDHRRPDGPHRRRADRLDGHRHADRRAVASGRACCSTTSRSCSPRSPTRRSTRSARSSSPPSASTVGPEAQPARAGPGELPPARAAVPDHRQRRAGQDRPRQRRRRRCPGLAGASSSAACTASPAAAWRCERALDAIRREVSRGDRRRRAHHRALRPQQPTRSYAPIPSLLLTAAVHHHLIREKKRTKVGLIVECGDAREVHHMALLDRLRRRRDQPVPRVRVDRGHGRRGPARPRRDRPAQGGEELHQGVPARACSR